MANRAFVAWVAKRTLTPGDGLFEPGIENYLVAPPASARRGERFSRLFRRMIEATGDKDFRVAESHGRLPRHTQVRATTRLERHSVERLRRPRGWSIAGGSSLPTSLAVVGGRRGAGDVRCHHHDQSRKTAESRLKAIYVGTISPSPPVTAGGGRCSRRETPDQPASTFSRPSDDDLEKWDNVEHVIAQSQSA